MYLCMKDAPQPSEVLEGAKPEVREGPFGIPYVKPKAAPEAPDL